jgi:hypothetical protein
MADTTGRPASSPCTAGDTRAVAAFSGVGASSRALAAIGTVTREKGKVQRQRQLLALAKELVEANRGREIDGQIVLALKAKELHGLFRERHPEFQRTQDKTLETDRRECRPSIALEKGRPPKTSATQA